MTLRSRREQLLWMAERLGLNFPSSISDNELASLIKNRPATAKQRKILNDFLRSQPGNRQLPSDITFGKAGDLIKQLMEMLNQRAIAQLDLAMGAILRWRRAYFYVTEMGSVNVGYKVRLQQVSIWRAPGSPKAEFAAASRAWFRVNPVTLLYDEAEVVDLIKWRLPASAEKLFHYDDELPF